jgi:hypothetical protein
MKQMLPLFIGLLLLAMNTFSQNWTGIGSDHPVKIQQHLVSSSEESVVINFEIKGFMTNSVETPRGKAQVISVTKMVSMLEAGTPDVPKYAVSAIIPDLALMDVRVIKKAYTDFPNIDVAPSKGDFTRDIDPETVPYTYGGVYDTDAFFPELLAELQEPYILRDFRGQVVTIYPFSYNPVSKTLRVYHELTVEIYKTGTGGENQFLRNSFSERTDKEFVHIYNRHFINYTQSRYPVLEEEGNLLIICHGPFMSAMQPLVDWKKTIGRPTVMVDMATVGTTAADIKSYVANYYNTNGLTHLLLVGDHQQVPSHPAGSAFSDNTFGYIVGNDSYNEVFVGRFSAETVAHVETQVQKSIEYERDIDETQTWLNIGMGIARNEGAGNGHNGGESDYVHMDYIRDSLLNYTYLTVHQEYDGNVPGIPNTNSTIMSQRFNEGVSITNFCNHGSMTGWSVGGFNIGHVNNLTNAGKLPFIWSVACDNGRFTSGTCFAEAWLRATDNTTGEPTGAVATMMSWISQPWQPPMTGQDEMVTILVEGYENNIKRTMGGNSINGSMKMIDLHGNSGQNTHDTWILFGDPSLTVRTDNPTLMTVTHLPAAFLGMTEFTVSADAEDAIVSLTINNEILGTGYIINGSATVTFPALNEPGTMTVAVFAYNRVTYLQNIDVIPANGPYVVYNSSTVDDFTGGNGNGLIDYGETIVLGVELKNIGTNPVTNLTASLSTSSAYVSITDSTQFYGTILPDQVVNIPNAFTFDVADDVPDNHNISFELTMVGTEDSWNAAFSKIAYAPLFEIANSFLVDDAVGGNNNGQADPGETVNIIIPTTNWGGSQALNVEGVMVSANPNITINSGTHTFPVLNPGQTSDAVFNITVDPDTPAGTPVFFEYQVSSGEYDAEKDYILMVGLIFEDFESGGFSSFDWTFAGNLPWVVTDVDPHEGVYSAKSGTIAHNQSSQMILEYEVGGADSISFYRRVSSENNYDYLRFYVNNEQVAQWAGNVPWGRVAFAVGEGGNVFKWEYMKDNVVSSGEDCAWVDYIVFPAPVVCPAPQSLTASDITSTSVMLHWDSGSNEGEWNIIWGIAGFDPDIEGTLITDIINNPYLLEDLTHSTEYDFYVRADCGVDGFSSWSGPGTFMTLCDIFMLPFSEDFSGSSIVCWSFPEGAGNWDFGDMHTPPSSTSGAPNAYFDRNPQLTNYSYSLTSPVIDASGLNEVKIDYFLFLNNNNNSTFEQLTVECKAVDAGSWLMVEIFNNGGVGSGSAEFIRENQSLPGMQGQQFQVRFHAHGSNSNSINGWGLNDVHIHGEGMNAAISIQADASEVCQGENVTFTADPVNGGNNPAYQWFVNGEEAGENSPEFSYYPDDADQVCCELTSNMPGVTGSPVMSEIMFMTVFPMPVVTWNSFAYDTVCINWGPIELTGALPEGGAYSGPGVNAGFFNPDQAGAGDHTLFYSYSTDDNCSATDSLNIFVDYCTFIEMKNRASGIHIYPNPAHGRLYIQNYDLQKNIIEVHLCDLFGRRLLSHYDIENRNPYLLDVSLLSRGVYIIEILTEQQRLLEKVIIQ